MEFNVPITESKIGFTKNKEHIATSKEENITYITINNNHNRYSKKSREEW